MPLPIEAVCERGHGAGRRLEEGELMCAVPDGGRQPARLELHGTGDLAGGAYRTCFGSKTAIGQDSQGTVPHEGAGPEPAGGMEDADDDAGIADGACL